MSACTVLVLLKNKKESLYAVSGISIQVPLWNLDPISRIESENIYIEISAFSSCFYFKSNLPADIVQHKGVRTDQNKYKSNCRCRYYYLDLDQYKRRSAIGPLVETKNRVIEKQWTKKKYAIMITIFFGLQF